MNTETRSASIQFFRGTDEKVIPEIRLTRGKDGRTGQAIFIFEQPEALAEAANSEIKGMYLIDEEGEMVTREVNAKFVNGSASALLVTYIWKTEKDFERFMRFAKRYAKKNGLGYTENK